MDIKELYTNARQELGESAAFERVADAAFYSASVSERIAAAKLADKLNLRNFKYVIANDEYRLRARDILAVRALIKVELG